DTTNSAKKDNETSLYLTIIGSENFSDVVDQLMSDPKLSDISVDTPCNTDAFQCFINLPDIPQVFPDIPQVFNDPSNIKLYRTKEANKLIQDYISELFTRIYETDKLDRNFSQTTLTSLVKKLNASVPSEASHENFQDFC
ncbi:MAG: hypothetical protein MR804_06290, partial [Limosilactobacillus reuteri]|nr:hypothetical protein [Limosilactobacillus reuteri]